MIILDSSAALAVILREAREPEISVSLRRAHNIQMSVANALECVMRLAPSPEHDNSTQFDAFVALNSVKLTPIDAEQFRLARAGFIAYGKGRHPAGLNFGDCFAYALAKSRDAPLLFVGGDFAKTDVKRAV